MKKTLLNLLLVGFVGVSFKTLAQPVLDASCNPIIGYTSNIAINSGFPEGPFGSNQLWNFSNIDDSATVSTQYVSVGSTPYATSFSSSNIVAFDGFRYNYYTATNDALTLNGSADTISYPFSNGEDILRFPFTLGDTYSNSWLSPTGPIVINIIADGFGTLITPNGTYLNTLRVKHTKTFQVPDPFGGTFDGSVVTYSWFKNGIKESLASTSKTIVLWNGTVYSSSSGGTYALGAVGTEENSLIGNLELFPNPAQETINLTMDDENISKAKVKIINQLGQEVSPIENVNYLAGNAMQFDVAHLKNGIYTLQLILEDNSVINKRFTVSK